MTLEIQEPASSVVVTLEQPSFWRKHGLQIIGLLFWLTLMGGYAYYYRTHHLTTQTALLQLVQWLDSPYGPLFYILIYALRPLIFFSAAALTIASGSVFGAGSPLNLALAVIYTFIGSLSSASVAYLIGRFFGKGLLQKEQQDNVITRYAERMRQNSFETILIMRFIFLPYDLVNYLAGLLQISWRSFTLATFLGSIPGTIAFVSFGASLDLKEWAMGKAPMFNPKVLLFGAVIFLLSLAISRYYKRREPAA